MPVGRHECSRAGLSVIGIEGGRAANREVRGQGAIGVCTGEGVDEVGHAILVDAPGETATDTLLSSSRMVPVAELGTRPRCSPRPPPASGSLFHPAQMSYLFPD